MGENATATGSSPEAKDDLELFQAIWREDAGLDPIRLQEVRRKRCMDNYHERLRAISRLGVEARQRKAARAAETGYSAPSGTE